MGSLQMFSLKGHVRKVRSIFVIHDFAYRWWMNTRCTVILEALLHTSSYLQAGSIFFPTYPESRTKTLHPFATAIT